MHYDFLGATNLKVSRWCLGTMMFGGKTDASESTRIIQRAFEHGINFVDTANTYTGGESEKITGAAIKSFRDQVVLASKVGSPKGESPNLRGISRFNIINAVEASLQRLGTDRIDLLYIHWPADRMNLAEMVRALEDLVRQGKILYPAFSNFPAWLACRSMWLQDVAGAVPVAAGQYPYNVLERGLEVEILPFAVAMGAGIVCYRPLSAGFLTGKYSGAVEDGRLADTPRLKELKDRYDQHMPALVKFAKSRGFDAGQAAVAWVANQRAVTSALVGVSRFDQVDANLKAFEWEMSEEERDTMSTLFPTEVWEEGQGRFPQLRRSYDIVPG